MLAANNRVLWLQNRIIRECPSRAKAVELLRAIAVNQTQSPGCPFCETSCHINAVLQGHAVGPGKTAGFYESAREVNDSSTCLSWCLCRRLRLGSRRLLSSAMPGQRRRAIDVPSRGCASGQQAQESSQKQVGFHRMITV